MIDWHDEGIVLSRRRHGESAALVEVFTAARGRCAGIVPGGAGRRAAPTLMAGNQVAIRWRARLAEHLGTLTAEPLRARAAAVLDDPARLAALGAAAALLAAALPERDPHPALYARSIALLDALAAGVAGWPATYLGWELALLADLGFGLDLGTCALSGTTEDLVYISPRTGRAVARAAAGEWADKLLPFPPCLTGAPPAGAADLAAGLRVTGHFLARHLPGGEAGRPLPAERGRLADILARQG